MSTSVKPEQFGGLEHNMLEVVATETKPCEVPACLYRQNGNVTVRSSCFSELPRYGEEYREILRPSDLAVSKKRLRRTVQYEHIIQGIVFLSSHGRSIVSGEQMRRGSLGCRIYHH